MTCRPELVTGYLDGALDGPLQAEVEEHLATCSRCREQLELERRARDLLRALPRPEPRAGFEDEVRRRLRTQAPSRWRWALPLAAGLAALVLWGRSSAPFVTLELALDHAKCFSRGTLPAELWTAEPEQVTRWFSERGTPLPPFPASAARLSLVGARYCPLLDRRVAHLYYTSDGRHLSLFVVPGPLRGGEGAARRVAGRYVQILTVAGQHVGIVAEHREDVAAFERSFHTTLALGLNPDAPRYAPRPPSSSAWPGVDPWPGGKGDAPLRPPNAFLPPPVWVWASASASLYPSLCPSP